MIYELIYTDTALKQLKKLDRKTHERIIRALERVRYDPFKYVRKLTGRPEYRLRVGDYRVLMLIDQGKLIILIVGVGHRRRYIKKVDNGRREMNWGLFALGIANFILAILLYFLL